MMQITQVCSLALKCSHTLTMFIPDLPKPLKLSSKFYEKDGKSKMKYRSMARLNHSPTYKSHVHIGLYARIDAKGPFSTALTTANPNHKGGRLLHPTVCSATVITLYVLIYDGF
jgi:hypothetical protein